MCRLCKTVKQTLKKYLQRPITANFPSISRSNRSLRQSSRSVKKSHNIISVAPLCISKQRFLPTCLMLAILHSFIAIIYIAPLYGTYSETLQDVFASVRAFLFRLYVSYNIASYQPD